MLIIIHTYQQLSNDCCIRFMRLCGDLQKVINTNGYKIAIWFHSDRSESKKGFIANITWGESKYTLTHLVAN